MNLGSTILLTLALLPFELLAADAFRLEPGVDRPGSDITQLALEQADPSACAQHCADTPNCRAFTYVEPGVQGESAMCWLKDAVPDPVASACCTSGLRSSGFSWGIDRPGADYRSFELATEEPALCEQACSEDDDCRAFTYVRPGVQGDAPRCWLKDAVPEPVESECCASGVRAESP